MCTRVARVDVRSPGVCVCCLIAVGMETSVISRRSLPCRPANNQHPLCACSTSRCLSSSLSPPCSLLPSPPLSHACCHNDKPHSAIVPCCSPTRTKNGGGYLPPRGGLVEIEEGKGGLLREWNIQGKSEEEFVSKCDGHAGSELRR